MFGRDTDTPRPKKPFELRPLRTTTIDEVLTPIPELGTQDPLLRILFLGDKSRSDRYTPRHRRTIQKSGRRRLHL